MKLPITAWASISHRITGVIMFLMTPLMVWILDLSLRSEESFAAVGELLSTSIAKLLIWGIATVLTYHSLAGLKHLIADMGYGEEMDQGVLMARLVILLAAFSALLWGSLIW